MASLLAVGILVNLIPSAVLDKRTKYPPDALLSDTLNASPISNPDSASMY